MKLKKEMYDGINRTLLSKFGISYDEFAQLDFDEQQMIIEKYHKTSPKIGRIFMIGSGEHAIFRKGDAQNSINNGMNLEETRKNEGATINDNKSGAYVRKLVRKFNK